MENSEGIIYNPVDLGLGAVPYNFEPLAVIYPQYVINNSSNSDDSGEKIAAYLPATYNERRIGNNNFYV